MFVFINQNTSKCGWGDPDGSKEKGKTGGLSVWNVHPLAFSEGWLPRRDTQGEKWGSAPEKWGSESLLPPLGTPLMPV